MTSAAGEAVLIASSGRCGQDNDAESLENDDVDRLRGCLEAVVADNAEVVCSAGFCGDAGGGIREVEG